ncbi:MAG: PQQ-dependent sugar dehydrogenase [Thermoleophilaceae bacterium]
MTKAQNGFDVATSFRFAPDGRVFVGEKSGKIDVYDSPSDTTPTLFADLRRQVYNYWDRGLIGLAVDPNFPASPYVYVLYTYDGDIGGSFPKYGGGDGTSDGCADPTGQGCVVSGRLSRLTIGTGANADKMVGSEQVLVDGWCQQFPSHSVGGLEFGADGYLYAAGGDGASFGYEDYGQTGNPCGDPPGAKGTNLTPPTAEGGALRSQDVVTPSDPTGVNGSVIRIDPSTGLGAPGNPFATSTDANAQRIVAYGFRNPFRIAFRPGTNDLWVGDVGNSTWEELNHTNAADSTADNFGWPCWEGAAHQGAYEAAGTNLCNQIYANGGTTMPFLAYNHSSPVVSGETCRTGSGSSVTGVRFSPAVAPYPSSFQGGLFFADRSRQCIWYMPPGSGGIPDKNSVQVFETGAHNPVDLQIGPDNKLWFMDFDFLGGATGSQIHRIDWTPGNQAPVAKISANPTNGATPLNVSFDGTGSSDPEGGPITYRWDLNGDGAYGDSTSATPSSTYTATGVSNVGLEVTDNTGQKGYDHIAITAGNSAPTAVITTPLPSTTWKVGDPISFSGSATDAQDGNEPASRLTWSVIMHHCTTPNTCHTHPVQDYAGVASGSFNAPDHEYPSWIEVALTVTDAGGLSNTQSVRLDPKTADVTMKSTPSGLKLALDSSLLTTQFTKTVILGSNNSISAGSPQRFGSRTYYFRGWSDDGAQSHNVTINGNTTLTATYGRIRLGSRAAAKRRTAARRRAAKLRAERLRRARLHHRHAHHNRG